MSEEIVAYCGLTCTECPAYIATQDNDMEALQQLAEQWSKEFNVPISAKQCMCDGCLGDGQKAGFCSLCPVRSCAAELGMANCAHCDDYACQKLTNLWNMFSEGGPQAKATLDKIQATLH